VYQWKLRTLRPSIRRRSIDFDSSVVTNDEAGLRSLPFSGIAESHSGMTAEWLATVPAETSDYFPLI